jgi:DNA-binding CsgD family transcriptional regulator
MDTVVTLTKPGYSSHGDDGHPAQGIAPVHVRASTVDGMQGPSLTAVKVLYALSGNICYYTGCDLEMTNPTWKRVRGQVAHIAGENPDSARYDAGQASQERRAYDNLILLCPLHHNLIDDLLPHEHSVSRLLEMKEAHIEHMRGSRWIDNVDEGMLIHFARQTIAYATSIPPLAEWRPSGSDAERLASLNPRQEALLDALLHGLTPEDISNLFRLQGNTVSGRISRLLGKLRVSSQREALAIARCLAWEPRAVPLTSLPRRGPVQKDAADELSRWTEAKRSLEESET